MAIATDRPDLQTWPVLRFNKINISPAANSQNQMGSTSPRILPPTNNNRTMNPSGLLVPVVLSFPPPPRYLDQPGHPRRTGEGTTPIVSSPSGDEHHFCFSLFTVSTLSNGHQRQRPLVPGLTRGTLVMHAQHSRIHDSTDGLRF